MTLFGIAPDDPIPSDRRQITLAAGAGPGVSLDRTVVIYGMRTAAGSETLDTLDMTRPILSDADAVARFGRRSEWYWGYKAYVAVDPGATVFGVAVTEGAGVAATVGFTIAGGASATGESSLDFNVLGTKYSVPVHTGDVLATITAAAVLAMNDAESSGLPFAFTDASPIVNCAFIHKGLSRGAALGGAGYGVVASFSAPCGLTVTKGAVTPGTLEDDGTAAIASAANAENFYHVLPWTAVAVLSATDKQIGQLNEMLKTQGLPINGKEQISIFAHTDSQALQTTVCTSVGANTWQSHCVWQKHSQWLPIMLAAHHCAIKRANEVAHPGANIAGWAADATRIYQVPPPLLVADRPSQTEIRAALNNGGSPIAVTARGKTYLVRDVTTRSELAAGDKDYKAREGHIYSVCSFFWKMLQSTWKSVKQPLVDNDPAPGVMPSAGTSTPSQLKAVAKSLIDDLCSNKPLGIYDKPILAPSQAKTMKDRVRTSKIPAGLSLYAEIFAIEHNLKSETELAEVGGSY